MDCLQYHYSNEEDAEKYKIKCENMTFPKLNDVETFNNKELLEFIDETYSDDAFKEESPFTFSDDYIKLDNTSICKSSDMSLGPQQKFMGQIMGPSSNFNNILVYHGLGSGKSCTSIVIGEALKKSTSSRIIYAVPAPLVDQYFEEIAGEIRNGSFFSCPSFCLTKSQEGDESTRNFYVSETKNNNLLNLQRRLQIEISKLDEAEILIEIEDTPINKKNFASQQRKVDLKKFELERYQDSIRDNIKKTFEIISHNKFIESLYKTGKNKEFIKGTKLTSNDSALFKKNGLLIIDEIQRLVSSGGTFYKKLYDAIKYYFHPSLKLVLMSATPIYDNPYELALTVNLLRPRVPFPITPIDFYSHFIGEIKTKDDIDICEKQSSPLKTWVTENSCILNDELIKYICSGYISYFKGGNPNAYPYKRVISVNHGFSNKHKSDYIDALASDTKRDREINLEKNQSSNYENILMGNYDREEDDKVTGIFITTQQYSNITLPREKSGINKSLADKKNSLSEFRRNMLSKKTESTRDIIEYVKEVSVKFASIIETTLDSKGPVFIFSNWLTYGVEPLAIILESLGFINFKNGLNTEGSNKFFVWNSSTKTQKGGEELIKKARNTFNSAKNSDGSLLKVILGTRSVMEGVSFKNVRQVHITDPWWNESRIEQILARASRYCSHSGLEKEEQYVDIFRHYSVYPGDGIDEEAAKKIGGNYKGFAEFSIEEKMVNSSLKKYSINNELEQIIKSASIDCNINKNGNIIRLEEYCNPVGMGMYQIYYKNPSNGRMYIRDGIPDTLSFEQIKNREYSFPRKDLPLRFTEAGDQGGKDGYSIITAYEDDPDFLDENNINEDLNIFENIKPWDSDKKLSDLDLEPNLKKYITNLYKNYNLLPRLRKDHLNEIGGDRITFKEITRNDNRELVDCIKRLSSSDISDETLRKKINNYFTINSKKDNLTKKVLELIKYGDYEMNQLDDLVDIAIQHPDFIENQIKMYKNKS